MTGAGSVKTSDAADFEADSSTYSSEFASTSAYGRGMASDRSETSTVLTLPEMDESYPSSIRKSRNLPQLRNNDDRSLEPVSPVSIVNSAKLVSTSAYERGVMSSHNQSSTVLPLLEMNESSASSITRLHELPQLDINEARSPQPVSSQPVLNSAELASNSAHGRNRVSNRSEISPALSLPEIDENNPWGSEEAHELSEPQISRPESPSLSPYPTLVSVADVPELGENTTSSHIEKQSEAFAELDHATSHPAASAPAVTHNHQPTDDDPGDEPLVWLEYDEDELRIDWTRNASGE